MVVAGWRLGVGDDDLRWRPWWVVVTSAGGDLEAARRWGGGGVAAAWRQGGGVCRVWALRVCGCVVKCGR